MMRRTLVVLSLAAAMVPLWTVPSWACSCAHTPPRAHARQMTAIFLGTAQSVPGTDVYDLSFRRKYPVRFEVDVAYKGNVRQEMRVLSWGGGSAACGLLFEEGHRYTVFAYEHQGHLETNLCTSTTEGPIDPNPFGLSGSPIDGQAAPPTVTSERTVDRWPWIAAAVAAAVAAAGAALAASRARRSGFPG